MTYREVMQASLEVMCSGNLGDLLPLHVTWLARHHSLQYLGGVFRAPTAYSC